MNSLLLVSVSVTGAMTLGEIFVAVGTLALAIFTWRLAKATSSQLALTRRGLDLARESNEASDRPWVIPSPDESGRLQILLDVTPPKLAFRLWNVGRGPAIVTEILLRHADGSELLASERNLERPVATSPPVRDELIDLARNAPPECARLEMLIRYRGPSTRTYETRSEIDVQGDGRLLCRGYNRSEVV